MNRSCGVQQTFGYTGPTRPGLSHGPHRKWSPIGFRWAPTPRSAAISERSWLLFDYFAQLFAQVTNPPLDALREEIVTSLGTTIGPEGNLLEADAVSCRQLRLPFPVITNDDLAKIANINAAGDRPGLAGARCRVSTGSPVGARRCAGGSEIWVTRSTP